VQIAGTNVIQDQEKKFIDSIADSLDWQTIKKLLAEKYQVEISGEPDYKAGEFLLNDSGIGYKFDFDVKILLQLSVSCDRNGNCTKISSKASEKSILDNVSSAEVVKEEGKSKLSLNEKEVSESDHSLNNNPFESKESEKQSKNETGETSSRDVSNMASQIATMIGEINS